MVPNYDPSKGYGYGYYASPTTLRANDTGASHSPILGFAYDGNPIYGAYGYINALDASSTVIQMSSSYSRNSSRVGPSTTTYPIGTFIDDYTFTDGSGTLDQNNGRFVLHQNILMEHMLILLQLIVMEIHYSHIL